MRLALAAVLVASCASPEDGRSPLTPSEFHLFGSRSWADADGNIGPRGEPNWNLDTSSSSDGWALGAGFTWLIGAPASSTAMRDLVRELKIQRAADHHAAPSPVVVVPVTTTTPDTDDDPDHVHEPGQGPTGPVPVTLEGAREDVWLKLLGSLALLVTAAAGYLGRERIPVVKRYTSKGKLAALEAELAELQDEQPGD